MSWKTIKLGDIAEFSNGVNFDKSAYTHGVKLIGVSNFGERFIPDYDELSEVRPDVVRKNDYLQDGDIVFVRSNGNKALVGRCMLVKNPPSPVTYSGFCIRCRIKDISRFDPVFFTYHFKNKTFRQAMAGTAVGANIQNLSQGRMTEYTTNIPGIETQLHIASILSAYDDLIENNQKQIKLLEEVAQRLYKEWFVDLRFPGHETTPIVDGVPEGWKKDRADSFFDITIGKTPPRAESHWFTSGDKGIPWLSISDMGNAGVYSFVASEGLSEEAVTKHNMKVVPAGTIFVSFKLTVGRVSIATGKMCTNEAIAHFRVDDSLRYYTYLYLKAFEYDKLGNTSAISKAVNSKIIKAMPFIMPDRETMNCFSMVVAPIFKEIYAKQKQTLSLIEARDRLLPKLMSGEIEV